MYRKILLAYDGSEAGRSALFECSDVAALVKAEIHLIAVVQPLPAAVLYEVVVADTPDLADETQRFQRVLDEGVKILRDRGYECAGHLARGEPVDQIADAARRLGVDLIIVGHRRAKGWAERWWRGSLGATLMDSAPCSVLISLNPPLRSA